MGLRGITCNVIRGLVILVVLAAPIPSQAQYESVVIKVSPAVVFIKAVKPGIGTASGSGFFIESSGYILTARHVIGGASSVMVRTPDGNQTAAAIVNYSTVVDAAALKVKGTGFPVLRLGDSSVIRQGQEVLVFGYPLGNFQGSGAESVTVTRGIVSALRTREGLIQIDATVNPGNSGGPAVTTSGDVIGLVVSGYLGRQGLNFAVTASALQDLTIRLTSEPKPAPPAPASEYPLNGQWSILIEPKSGAPESGPMTCNQDGESVTCQTRRAVFQGRFDADANQLTLSYKGFNGEAMLTGELAAPGLLEGEYTARVRYSPILFLNERGTWTATKTSQKESPAWTP
jgi:hypothetical protein